MEGLNQLLNPVLGLLNSEHLEKYLSTCREHLAFYGQDKKNETHIRTVNQLLNDNSDRYGGLTVLRVILEQCSLESYQQNAISWLTNCVKATNDQDIKVVNISFDVLGLLLEMATKFPEIKKFASNNVVPRFLEHTKRLSNSQTISSFLECLRVCMKDYSGPCGSFRKSIMSLLSKLVDSDSNLLTKASKCYALLAQIKCSSNPGVSYNTYWKENQMILVNTLHYHMDRLFSNVTEIQVYQRNENSKKKLLLDEQQQVKSKSVLLKFQLIEKRMKGICFYLQSMLLGPFPVPKPILPDAILGVICRGLAITCASLGPIKTDSIALGSVLPDVHVNLLNLLMDLITLCKRNMIPYGSVICKLIAQELKWTISTDWPYAQDKPYRNLRAIVYRCLRCWLSVGRAASSLEAVLKEIIPSILLDIKMEKQKVILKILKGQGSSTSANQTDNDFTSEMRSEKLAGELANEELCLEALKCLQIILSSYSTKLEAETCKLIQESVLELLYGIQNVHEALPVPYRSSSCRRELYNNLITLCLEPHNEFPPPVTFAISLLNRGLGDSASEVSIVCNAGLSSIEKIIHPSGPPLPGAVQYHQVSSLSNFESGQDIRNSINENPRSKVPYVNITLIHSYPSDKGSSDEPVRTDVENLVLTDSVELDTNEATELVDNEIGEDTVVGDAENLNLTDSIGLTTIGATESVDNEDGEDRVVVDSVGNADEGSDIDVQSFQESTPIDEENQSSLLLASSSEIDEAILNLDSNVDFSHNDEENPPDDIVDTQQSNDTVTNFEESSNLDQSKSLKRTIEVDIDKSNSIDDDLICKRLKTLPDDGINGSYDEENTNSLVDTSKKVNGFDSSEKKLTEELDGPAINEEEMMSCFVDEVN